MLSEEERSEEERLLKKARELREDFRSLPLYQRYLALKKSHAEEVRIQNAEKEVDSLKKSLRFLSSEERKDVLEKAKAIQKSLDEEPLLVNEKSVQASLLALLAPLREAKL